MTNPPTIAVMEATSDQLDCCLKKMAPLKGIPYSTHPNDIGQLPPEVQGLLIYTGKTQQETLSICNRLRKHPRTACLPIILVAPSFDITHTFVVKRAGNATLLTEPFTADELRDCLEEVTETVSG